MLRRYAKKLFRRRQKKTEASIYPDETLLDSSNLPRFDRHQFEGRIERPLSRRAVISASVIFAAVAAVFLGKLWMLQVAQGEEFRDLSENNRLRHTVLFSDRGLIYDRRGEILAKNRKKTEGQEFARREYTDKPGLAHILGYVKYPTKDSAGFYYKEDFEGITGAERFFDAELSGKNGTKIVETNVRGEVESESVLSRPADGENAALSVDAELSAALYGYISDLARRRGFTGGAAVVMDVKTGEVIALTSVPEYDPDILSDGKDTEAIAAYQSDPRTPFLNRAARGLYTPGSIVKLFVSAGALAEGAISPETNIISRGEIAVQNPYDPSKETIFKDWKAHGAVDMREAIAVSSNVYFYAVGGGYKDQKGLGIKNIEKYARRFGLGEAAVPGHWLWGEDGVIPNPDWKAENFKDGIWRLGDTYHTAIGQYGFLVTPLQTARAVAAIANGGTLVQPALRKMEDEAKPQSGRNVGIDDRHLQVVREGMRQAVISGTAKGLWFPDIKIAAKTGTAEIDSRKQFAHSWAAGYFPYENPRYSFAILMERGPHDNTIGGIFAAREMFEWMRANRPEYLR